MQIRVNERECSVEAGLRLRDLRDRVQPQADVLIVNGAPTDADQALCDGDAVVLIQRGVLPSPDELDALMAARHTPGVHDVVRRARVGIAGLGGLGSAVAVALARTGVGRLVLADFDIVEPSNLNRQQYFVDQIGQLKTDALCENLQRINPCVAVEAHACRLDAANAAHVFADVDVLVEAFDDPAAKAMLVEACATAFPHRPIVTASGMAGLGSANTIRTHRAGGNVYVVGDLTSAAGPGNGLMAPRVGVAAHHQACAVLRLLLGLDVNDND
jgi:sulfur carrier protein ThiS adenylyltransferase